MKPIDESSTLADLAKLREAYGITTMMITVLHRAMTAQEIAHKPPRVNVGQAADTSPLVPGTGRFCSLYGPAFDVATGQGATEAEAIADAVRSIERMRMLTAKAPKART